MGIIRLDTPLFEALGAKNVFLRRLEKLGVKTIGDLLRHFPSRYEDFSHIANISDLNPGEETTVRGVVRDAKVNYTRRRGLAITQVTIEDGTGTIRAVWFNQPYLASAFRTGRPVNLAGKVSQSENGELYFSNPSHEFVQGEDTGAVQHTGRIIPIYPETRGLTSRGIRFVMGNIFKRKLELDEWLPQEILAQYAMPDMREAFSTIHFPNAIEDAYAAKRRFLFEDLFLLQLVNLSQRLALAEESAPAVPADVEHLKTILATLPFELTTTQKRSLWEVMQDMERSRPMNRLLQGDVGSGKTIVAALAALAAARHGLQTAFMAPTEILARQHFQTFQKFFSTLSADEQTSIGLITSASASVAYEKEVAGAIKKEEFWKNAAAGKLSIIFGTHALIQKSARFKNLGLVIVDEQHRFGVRQRQALLETKGSRIKYKEPRGKAAKSEEKNFVPHFLSMSATPIPRTIMMTVFGDLDVSLITELPSGRRPIETKIVEPHERTKTYAFVRKEVRNGRQVFVICPRIEEEESGIANRVSDRKTDTRYPIPDRGRLPGVELKSVKTEYEKLSKKIFPDLRVAMLHGQMKAKEKEEIMKKFSAGETDILVSTSVIEVGVDVPNATIMMIEGADRFGLAQLYQFRGRVGRGAHQSYCFLLTDSESSSTKARLNAILSAKNGFELAEKDLALRGPGEFFGETQSGMPDIAMDALKDPELVKTTRDAALAVMHRDPYFQNSLALKTHFAEFKKRLHLE